MVQWELDLKKIVAKTKFLVHTYVVRFKKYFLRPNVQFKKEKFPKMLKDRDFLTILEQFQKKMTNFLSFQKKHFHISLFS